MKMITEVNNKHNENEDDDKDLGNHIMMMKMTKMMKKFCRRSEAVGPSTTHKSMDHIQPLWWKMLYMSWFALPPVARPLEWWRGCEGALGS